LNLIGETFGKTALPKDDWNSPIFHAMKMISIMRTAKNNSISMAGWVVFAAPSAGTNKSITSLTTLKFPWYLLAEFAQEVHVAHNFTLDRLQIRRTTNGMIDTTDPCTNVTADEDVSITRGKQVQVAYPLVWCVYISNDALAKRDSQVYHLYGDTTQTDTPVMDIDEEEEKMYLINSPMEEDKEGVLVPKYLWPNQMFKLMLGFGPDDQSTVVFRNSPLYGECAWPIKMSQFSWLWTPQEDEFEEVC